MKNPIFLVCIFILPFILLLAGCKTEAVAKQGADDSGAGECSQACTVLFGRPGPDTGLGSDMCRPFCNCGGQFFEPPVYTKEMVEKFSGKILKNPFEPLTANPYDSPEHHVPQPEKVCGVFLDADDPQYYSLASYDSVEELEADGGILSHYGACGLCSSLDNLAVYILVGDLTGPVRQCGLEGVLGGEEKIIACLMDIGFDYPCA